MSDLVRMILGHNRFRFLAAISLVDEPFEGSSLVWTYEDFTTGVIYQVAEGKQKGEVAYRRRQAPTEKQYAGEERLPEFGSWSEVPAGRAANA